MWARGGEYVAATRTEASHFTLFRPSSRARLRAAWTMPSARSVAVIVAPGTAAAMLKAGSPGPLAMSRQAGSLFPSRAATASFTNCPMMGPCQIVRTRNVDIKDDAHHSIRKMCEKCWKTDALRAEACPK